MNRWIVPVPGTTAHISTKSFLKEIWPFLIAMLMAVLVMIFMPELVTWLPNLLFDWS